MAKDELINKFKYIGTRPNRPDGLDKVTGRAKYGADFNAPNMLHAAVLRSPHAHARIVKIDTSKAEAHNKDIEQLEQRMKCNIRSRRYSCNS